MRSGPWSTVLAITWVVVSGIVTGTNIRSTAAEQPLTRKQIASGSQGSQQVPLPAGTGHREFDLNGSTLEVFTFKPADFDGRRMIVVIHGVNRNADEYRDHAKVMGTRFNALVVAPKFDAKRYPSQKFQRGGIFISDDAPAPEEQWTFNLIPQLARAVRDTEQLPELPYWIIGHSAGGQFVARMAAFIETGAERLVAANPGSHLFPNRSLPFGYGFGAMPAELSNDAALRRYLAAPLTLYLGTADNRPDRHFDSRQGAMEQGAGRWQRGRACFDVAQQLAMQRDWICNWKLVEAPDIPHDHERMFNHPQCSRALFGNDGDQVFTEAARQRLQCADLLAVAAEEMAQSRIPGAAIGIVVGDRLVFSQGLGLANVETQQPVDPEMLFRIGSTTKMFTAALLVSLADQGQLRLDESMGSHLPGIQPCIGELTPHHLLTHTSGLTDEAKMSGLHDDTALDGIVQTIDSTWMFAQPGEIYSYSNPGYWIAGLLGEKVTGKPFADALDQLIFQPAGMRRSTLRPLQAMTWPLALGHAVDKGTPAILRPQADNAATRPAGQIFSNVPELARWTALLMNQGRLEDQQVLSPSVVEQMMTPHVAKPGDEAHYGYGLSISSSDNIRLVEHNGSRAGYGSMIRMAPEHRVAVIVLTNLSAGSLPKTVDKAFASALGLIPASSSGPRGKRPQQLSDDEIQLFVGRYSNHRNTIELAAVDGQLQLIREGKQVGWVKRMDNRRIGAFGDTASRYPLSTYEVVHDAQGQPAFLCSRGRAYKKQADSAARP